MSRTFQEMEKMYEEVVKRFNKTARQHPKQPTGRYNKILYKNCALTASPG